MSQLGDEVIELDAAGASAGANAKDRIERIAVAGVHHVHDDIVARLHRTGHDRGIAAGRGDRGRRADRIGRDVCGRDATAVTRHEKSKERNKSETTNHD